MVVIADFIGWHNEGCSQELKYHINHLFLIPEQDSTKGNVPLLMRNLTLIRNTFVHMLDSLDLQPNLEQLMDNSTFMSILDKIKISLIDFIGIFHKNAEQITGNVSKLTIADTDRPLVQNITEIVRQLLCYLPTIPHRRDDQLTSNDQITIFYSAIAIGKSILHIISSELSKEINANYTVDSIINLFAQDSSQLGHQQLTIKIKYDALLQALGQSLGNLRQYERLTDISNLEIALTSEFATIEDFIPRIKEYRNLRTHCGYYNNNLFRILLYLVAQDCAKINNELDYLFHQIRCQYVRNYPEFDKICQRISKNVYALGTPKEDSVPQSQCNLS